MGFDIDPRTCDSLRNNGGMVAASVRELADRCRAIVIAVYSGLQAEMVLGDIENSPARPAIICTTTCAPDEVVRLATRAASAGIAFIEAPISAPVPRSATALPWR